MTEQHKRSPLRLELEPSGRSGRVAFHAFRWALLVALALLTFLLFGAAAVGPTLDDLTWEVVLYAVLSLTVIRMLPVALSLIGGGLQRFTVVFLSWFGPRGVASILFAIVVLDDVDFGATGTVFTVVSFTVLLSVFAHGLTAWPGANWYGSKAEAMQDEPDMPELMPVSEMPVRLRQM